MKLVRHQLISQTVHSSWHASFYAIHENVVRTLSKADERIPRRQQDTIYEELGEI